MNKEISNIHIELNDLMTIFLKKIPDLNFDIINENISIHLQPYIEWRDQFSRKTYTHKEAVIMTDKEKELLYYLFYVEYCCQSFNITNSRNYNLLIGLLHNYPDILNYKTDKIKYTYYPIINLLSKYCYSEEVRNYPSINTQLLYPILNNNDVDIFIQIFYIIENNKKSREQLIKTLLKIVLLNNDLHDIKYDFFMQNICKVPRIANAILHYVGKCIEDRYTSNFSIHVIDSLRIVYYTFIWFGKRMRHFIFKKRQSDIYYGYYLLNIFLYNNNEVSFSNGISNIQNMIIKYDIKFFTRSHYWSWLFETIVDLQITYPNNTRRTFRETKRIEMIYDMFKKNCNESYIIYSYYDSKLAWMICYPNNTQLVRKIYNDLEENSQLHNYERIFQDITRYGNYNLLINAWYYMNKEILYFTDSLDSYDIRPKIFDDQNAFTLAVFNKDKRVMKFICEHYNYKKMDMQTVCKSMYNILLFYDACCRQGWKKRAIIRECKYKLNLLLEHYYFKQIWIGFLMSYYQFNSSNVIHKKDISVLFNWLVRKCITIEIQNKNEENVTMLSGDLYYYTWVNKFEFIKVPTLLYTNKTKELIERYANIICDKINTEEEIYKYRYCIVYLFIDYVYNIQYNNHSYTDIYRKVESKFVDVVNSVNMNGDYMFTVFQKLLSIKNFSIKFTLVSTINKFKNIVGYLLCLLRKHNSKYVNTLFYVIQQSDLLQTEEILDWCIRNGMKIHDEYYWTHTLKSYYTRNNNYMDNIHYKWEQVVKIMKKYIFINRIKKNSFSKHILHIELLNKINSNKICENIIFEDSTVDKYHPKHITKNEAVALLQDSSWVSLKVDGIRTVLYLNDIKKMYPKLLQETIEICNQYYFIAEKVFFKNKYLYLIYEVWRKKDNYELNEFDIQQFYKMIYKQKKICKKKDKKERNIFSKKRLEMLLKDSDDKDIWMFKPFFYTLPKLDGIFRWQYIYNMYNFIPNDGLIVKTRKNEKFKIKPSDQMSIDLQVFDGIGKDKEGNTYKINTTEILLNDLVYNSNQLEKSIIQCVYNDTTKEWNVVKIRNDKFSPNSREIIKKIEEINEDPYWLYDIPAYI